MNDAYTIGITLALENGVSAGIQEIRSDLEELNRTVDASIGELVRLDTQVGATLRAVHQAARDSGLMQIAEAGQRLATRPSAMRLPSTPSRQIESALPEQTAPSAASRIPIVRQETTAFPSVAVRGESMSSAMRSIAEQSTLSPSAAPPPRQSAAQREATAPSLPPGLQQPVAPAAPLQGVAPPPPAAPLQSMAASPLSALPQPVAPPLPVAPVQSVAAPRPLAPSQLLISLNAPPASKAEVATSVGYTQLLPVAAPAALPNAPGSATTVSAAPNLTALAPTVLTQVLQPSDLATLVRRLAPSSAAVPSEGRSTPGPQGQVRPGNYGRSAISMLLTAGSRQVEASSIEPTFEPPLSAAPLAAQLTSDRRLGPPGEAVITNAAIPQGPAAPTTMSVPGAGMSKVLSFGTNSTTSKEPDLNQSAGSEMGHVFLDGQLVGRWMRGHLAQLATRPPSGSTGFDPKLGMIWPGAPIQG